MKKPASAGLLQIHELAALCEAALQPSRGVWDAFRGHLARLRDAGELTSDEAVAIVASDLTTAMLSEVGEDIDSDADTIAEVVDRVRMKYKEEAEAELTAFRTSAEHEIARERIRAEGAEKSSRDLADHVGGRVNQISMMLANVVAMVCLLVAIAGVVLSLPGLFQQLSSGLKAGGLVFSVLAGGIQVG